MKAIFALAAVALGSALVQAQYNVSSARFQLFIRSENATLNGSTLAACHQGAAIEGLCLSRLNKTSPSAVFYYNTSTDQAADTSGILLWDLKISQNQTVPSAMQFSINPTSNLATPIFFPGASNWDSVSFTEGCESIYRPMYLDDTVSPPTGVPMRKVESWYICLTRWSYLYYTLEWKMGITGEPQNPSCQKVGVYRVFL